MTTNIQQGTLLDVLKKKMRQTKEEMEKYKDECEEYQKRLQGEVIRREEVSSFFSSLPCPFLCLSFSISRHITEKEHTYTYILKYQVCGSVKNTAYVAI